MTEGQAAESFSGEREDFVEESGRESKTKQAISGQRLGLPARGYRDAEEDPKTLFFTGVLQRTNWGTTKDELGYYKGRTGVPQRTNWGTAKDELGYRKGRTKSKKRCFAGISLSRISALSYIWVFYLFIFKRTLTKWFHEVCSGRIGDSAVGGDGIVI
jgi:hypothetical protein